MAKKSDQAPVKIPGYRYHSPDVPLSAIRRYAKRIASRFDPHKIILFGSYAYGRPQRWSDVDLLVVIGAYDETNQAIRIINALEAPFSLDLVVRTRESIERDWRDGDWFVREVLAKGKVLVSRVRGRPDAKLWPPLAERKRFVAKFDVDCTFEADQECRYNASNQPGWTDRR